MIRWPMSDGSAKPHMRDTVFSLFSAIKPLKPRPSIAIEDILTDFESIGFDCEFGLVQRFCGKEPLGLFRFTAGTIPELIAALDEDLSGYGSNGDLELFEGPEAHFFCRSRRHGFSYNTGTLVHQQSVDALVEREYGKVRYLKERFLTDLAAGEKIFVRNGDEPFDQSLALVHALRRHGPVTMLTVTTVDDGRPVGDVRWRADGVLEGYLDRSTLFRSSRSVPLRPWLDLCRNAFCLARDVLPETIADVVPTDRSDGVPTQITRHRIVSSEGVVASHTTRKLRPGTMYVFSAWIWLPAEFRGDRVAADIGPVRYGYHEANLSVLRCWQRVWASMKPTKQISEQELRLRVAAPAGQQMWSGDWRLEEGFLPSESAPPPATPGIDDAYLGSD